MARYLLGIPVLAKGINASPTNRSGGNEILVRQVRGLSGSGGAEGRQFGEAETSDDYAEAISPLSRRSKMTLAHVAPYD